MPEEPLLRFLNRRPLLVALAGPNGAGKSTFYNKNLAEHGLPFVNADLIARDLHLDPYEAAKKAGLVRNNLVQHRSTFVFKTVFSDPVGDKIAFLESAASVGYTVVLVFIGVANPAQSEERVTIRVAQGGHDVPSEKLAERFPRTLRNLQNAIKKLPHVLVYDNSEFRREHRLIALYDQGRSVWQSPSLPAWFQEIR
jgi:predicted ABC-type ATPase